MTDRELFWAGVWADPTDEVHRGVFADWLDENGEVELADWMRDVKGWKEAVDFLRPYALSYHQDREYATFTPSPPMTDERLVEIVKGWHATVVSNGTIGWHMFPPDDLEQSPETAAKFFRCVERVVMERLPGHVTDPADDHYESPTDRFECCY